MKQSRRVRVSGVGLLLLLFAASVGILLPRSTSQPIDRLEPTRSALHCAQVGSGAWSPLPGLEYTGRLALTLPHGTSGRILLIVGDEVPLDVSVETRDGSNVPATKELLETARGASAPPPDYWLEGGTPWDAPQDVQRLTVRAVPDIDRMLMVRLGRRAPRVLARLAGYPNSVKAKVCAADLGVPSAFDDSQASFTVEPSFTDYFGTGWTGVEFDEEGNSVRRMDQYGAILIPSAIEASVHVRLRARRGGAVQDDTAPGLQLRVNGVRQFAILPLQSGTAVYDWEVPATAWVNGTNELLFSVSGIPRPRFLREPEARQFELAFLRLDVTRVQ